MLLLVGIQSPLPNAAPTAKATLLGKQNG